MASPKAFGLLQKPVSDILEEGRAAPAPTPATIPQPPTAPVLTRRALIDGAKDLGWRLKWQSETLKRAGSASRTRYGGYYGATTYEEALRLGAIRSDFAHDLSNGDTFISYRSCCA